jgi:23S rRNA (cytosine1962-C5)-methyltransferase
MQDIIVKPGREKSLLRYHPWVFSGALQEPVNTIRTGATVRLVDAAGKAMALGAWSPQSQIRVRIWSNDPHETIDRGFFSGRISQAWQRRQQIVTRDTDVYRLVNAESDGLPGLIVDRYAGFLVCQFLSAGVEFWKHEIIGLLQEQLSPLGIYERSDVEVRQKEGLVLRAGLLAGQEPPEYIQVRLDGIPLLVDVRKGHKTGLYLDQSANGRLIKSVARGREILNCFAYTGSFTLAALHGAADRVINVEASADALSLLERNCDLNAVDHARVENIGGDVFTVLRKFRDSGRSFDMIILDPPKFVGNARQLQRGSRGYKDINLLAFKLMRPGGILVTFSCSGHVAPDLFQKIVADAALDAGRFACIEQFLSQAPDHPVALNFPEGRYLKGLSCAVE